MSTMGRDKVMAILKRDAGAAAIERQWDDDAPVRYAESVLAQSEVFHLYNARDELLALAMKYAGECSACSGRGEIGGFVNGVAPGYETEQCPDCADIRAAIAKATGETK